MAIRKVEPRGIRNKNPLNIRIGNTWLGEVPEPNDPDFEQFVSMEYGLRAGFILLRRYIRHYKRKTIADIIKAWAPSSENNTASYIASISKLTGIPTDKELDYFDQETMIDLVYAMCKVECGVSVDKNIITEAYSIA